MRLDDDYKDQLREQIKIAAKKAKSMDVPSDGSMVSVLYGDLNKNGDHWQVEFIHDQRFSRAPWIAAYVWVNEKCPKCSSRQGAWAFQGKTRYAMQAYRNGKPKPNSYREDKER